MDKADLRPSYAILRQLPEGRALLRMAEDMNVSIYAHHKDGEKSAYGGCYRMTSPPKITLTLPESIGTRAVAKVLVHELRHMAQHAAGMTYDYAEFTGIVADIVADPALTRADTVKSALKTHVIARIRMQEMDAYMFEEIFRWRHMQREKNGMGWQRTYAQSDKTAMRQGLDRYERFDGIYVSELVTAMAGYIQGLEPSSQPSAAGLAPPMTVQAFTIAVERALIRHAPDYRPPVPHEATLRRQDEILHRPLPADAERTLDTAVGRIMDLKMAAMRQKTTAPHFVNAMRMPTP